MGLLVGKMQIVQGTLQWQQLHKSMEALAKDIWAYLAAIEPAEWDQQKVRGCIVTVESDLHRAQGIWPEGRSVLSRMSALFVRQVRVREEEHRLVLTGQPEMDFRHPEKSIKANNTWLQAMDKVGAQLESTGDEMLSCADEIKKWTSIDVRAILGWD